MNAVISESILFAVRAWLEQLESRDGYCGTLRRYHAHGAFSMRADTQVTVWQIGGDQSQSADLESVFDGIGASRCHFRRVPSDSASGGARDLSILCPSRIPCDVAELESIRTRVGADWPDLILINEHLPDLSFCSPEISMRDWLIFLYHVLEPGGLIVAPICDPVVALSEAREFDRDQRIGNCIVFAKETSIYVVPGISLANRSSIFDPGTCEESVTAAFRQINLNPESRMLDVGVGDGRFSQHFLREADKQGAEYVGIEMTSKPEIQPKLPELTARTLFDTNFFCFGRTSEFDLVALFFVFHSVKHWPLFLYHAWRVLKPGGRVLFANRDDRIIRWTHGRFFKDELSVASMIRSETARYWERRSACGARTFAQTTTIIDRDRCTQAAREMGFVLEHVVSVQRLRHYCLERRQLCPAEDEPAMWNIGRIGLSRTDRRELSKAFSVDVVQETLDENLFVTIMQKA
jgi:SAM-dependent methyltransferase